MQAPIITGISLNSENQLTVNATNHSKIEVTKQGEDSVAFTNAQAGDLTLTDGINSYTVAAVKDTNSEYFPMIVNTQELNVIQASDEIATVNEISLGQKDGDKLYKNAVDSLGTSVDLIDAITEIDDGNTVTSTLNPSNLDITGKIITITLNNDTDITLVFPGTDVSIQNPITSVEVERPQDATNELTTSTSICIHIEETAENNDKTSSTLTVDSMKPAAASVTLDDNNITCFTLGDGEHGDNKAIITGNLTNNSKLHVHTGVISSAKTEEEILTILPASELDDAQQAADDAQQAAAAAPEDQDLQDAANAANAALNEAIETEAQRKDAAKKYSDVKNSIKQVRNDKQAEKERIRKELDAAQQAADDAQQAADDAQQAADDAQQAADAAPEDQDLQDAANAAQTALNAANAELATARGNVTNKTAEVTAAANAASNLELTPALVTNMKDVIDKFTEQFNVEEAAPEGETAEQQAEREARQVQKQEQLKRETSFDVIFNNIDALNVGVEEEDKVESVLFKNDDFPSLGVKKQKVRAIKISEETEITTSANEAFAIKMVFGVALKVNGNITIKQQHPNDSNNKRFELTKIGNAKITYGESLTELVGGPVAEEFEGTMKLNVGSTEILLGSVTDVTPIEPVVSNIDRTVVLKYSPGQERPNTVDIFLDYTDGQDYELTDGGHKVFKKVQLREPVPVWTEKDPDPQATAVASADAANNPDPNVYERLIKQKRDERKFLGSNPNPTYGFYAWWDKGEKGNDQTVVREAQLVYLPISFNFYNKSTETEITTHVNAFFGQEQHNIWQLTDNPYTVYDDDSKLRPELFEGVVSDTVSELVWKEKNGTERVLSATDPSDDNTTYEPVYEQISETHFDWVEYALDDQGQATNTSLNFETSKDKPTTLSEATTDTQHGSVWAEHLTDYDPDKDVDEWSSENFWFVPRIQGKTTVYLTKDDSNDTRWDTQPHSNSQFSGKIYYPVYKENKGIFTISNFRSLNSADAEFGYNEGVLCDGEDEVNFSNDGTATINNALSYKADVFGNYEKFTYSVTDTDGNQPNEAAEYKLRVTSLLEMSANNEHKISVDAFNDTDTDFSLKFSDKFFTAADTNEQGDEIVSHKYRYKLKYFNFQANEDVIKITEKINTESLKDEILAFININDSNAGKKTLWPKNFATYNNLTNKDDAGTIQIEGITNYDLRPDETKAGLEVSRLDFIVLGPEFENTSLTIKDGEQDTDATGILTITGADTNTEDKWNQYITTAIDLSVDEYRLLSGERDADDGSTVAADTRSLVVNYRQTVSVLNEQDALRTTITNINIFGVNSAPELLISNLDSYSSTVADDITTVKLYTNNLNIFALDVIDAEDSEFTGLATVTYKELEDDEFASYENNDTDHSFLYTTAKGEVSTENLATEAHAIVKADSNFLITNNLKVGFWSVTYTVTDAGGKSSTQIFNIEVTDDTQVKTESNEKSSFTVRGTFDAETEEVFLSSRNVVTTPDKNNLPSNITFEEVQNILETSDFLTIDSYVFNTNTNNDGTREEGKDSMTFSVNTKLLEFLSVDESLFFFVDIAGFDDSAMNAGVGVVDDFIENPADKSYSRHRRVILEVRGAVSGVTIHVSEPIELKVKDAVLLQNGKWEWSIDMNNMATTIDKNAKLSISNDPAPNLFRCRELELVKDALFSSLTTNASNVSNLGPKYINLTTKLETSRFKANMYVFDKEFTVQKNVLPVINIDYKEANGPVIFTVGEKKTTKNNSTTDLAKRWKNLSDINLEDNYYYSLGGNLALIAKDKTAFNIPPTWDSDTKLQIGMILLNIGKTTTKLHIKSLSVDDQLDVSHSLSIDKEDSSKLIFRTDSGTNNGNTYYKCNLIFNNGQSELFSMNTPLLHSQPLENHMSNMPVNLRRSIVGSHEFSFSDNLEERGDGALYLKSGLTGYQKVFSKVTRRPLSVTGDSNAPKISTKHCRYLNVIQAAAIVSEEKEAQ